MIINFDFANLASVAVETSALAYAAFWANNVRKALAIQVYRKQAFGIGLIASILGLSQVVNTIIAYVLYHNPLHAFGDGAFGLFFVFLVSLFYYVDASVLAARRSDPLARDTFRWSKIRRVLWVATLPAAVIVILFDTYTLFATGGITGNAPHSAGVFLIPGIFIPLISAAVVLPVISFRTRDMILRKHLKWFGLFAMVYLFFNLYTGNQPNLMTALFLTYAGNIVGAYFLFRSALSLTPLKSFDRVELSSIVRDKNNTS